MLIIDVLIREFGPKPRRFTGFRPVRQNPIVFSVVGADGNVQCILSPRYKEKMLSTPGFPRPIFQANPPRHRAENLESQEQAAVRFLRDLGPGECVFAERPLLFAPTDLHCPDCPDHLNMAAMFPELDCTDTEEHYLALIEYYDRTYFEKAINGGSMDPEKRKAYLSLRLVEGERLPSDNRVVRPIDYFRPNTLNATTRPDSEGKTYKGVCQTLSRVKNKCALSPPFRSE
jgi:hypothetical protein